MKAKMVNIIQPKIDFEKVKEKANPLKKQVCAYCGYPRITLSKKLVMTHMLMNTQIEY